MAKRGEAFAELRGALNKLYAVEYRRYFRPSFDLAGSFILANPVKASDEVRNAFDHLIYPNLLLLRHAIGLQDRITEKQLRRAKRDITRAHRHLLLGTYYSLRYQMGARLKAGRAAFRGAKFKRNTSVAKLKADYAEIRRLYEEHDPPSTKLYANQHRLQAEIRQATQINTDILKLIERLDRILMKL
jgi:hypothetical protein